MATGCKDLTRIAVSLQSSNRRVRPRLVWRNGTLLASPVVHGVPGHFSTCGWYLRVSPDDTRGFSVPLRVVPSSKGLSSNRCPGIGILSRANREIGVFRHVSPSTRLCLKYPRETGLILRCTGKGGNPFKTKQGNRPSCRDQEWRRGPDVVVPGTSVFSSSQTSVSRNF